MSEATIIALVTALIGATVAVLIAFFAHFARKRERREDARERNQQSLVQPRRQAIQEAGSQLDNLHAAADAVFKTGAPEAAAAHDRLFAELSEWMSLNVLNLYSERPGDTPFTSFLAEASGFLARGQEAEYMNALNGAALELHMLGRGETLSL